MTRTPLPVLDPTASEVRARSRRLLVCVGLLACSAVLIAMARRGVVDGLANEVAHWAGLFLGLLGVFYLLQIWASNRFRISIGRLMALVVLFAVVCQGILMYRDWIKANLAKRPVGARIVPVDPDFLPAN